VSRSGYSDDCDDQWGLIRWRGAVASAIRGKRGQAFLREMLEAMDAMPEKRLIAHELEDSGNVCAIGSVGKARGIDMAGIDPEDYGRVADTFGINEKLAQEIVYLNDEAFWWSEDEKGRVRRDEKGSPLPITPEDRFRRMRAWIVSKIADAEHVAEARGESQ